MGLFWARKSLLSQNIFNPICSGIIKTQIFHIPNVIPITENALMYVLIRFIVNSITSMLSPFLAKALLQKFNKNVNTQKFIGI